MWAPVAVFSFLLLALAAAQSQFPPCRPCMKDKCNPEGLNCPGGLVYDDARCPCCFKCAKQESEYCDPPEVQDGSRLSYHYCDVGLACVKVSGQPMCRGAAVRSCPFGASSTKGCMNCTCNDGRVQCARGDTGACPNAATLSPCSTGVARRPSVESCCDACPTECVNPDGVCEGAPPELALAPPAKVTAIVGEPFSFSFEVVGVDVVYALEEPSNGASLSVVKVERAQGGAVIIVDRITVTGNGPGVYKVTCSNDGGSVIVMVMVTYAQRPVADDYCDFEDGMCNWRSGSKAKIAWTRRRGATETPQTGPTSGYGGSDYYVHVDTSHPAEGGDILYLQSPKITQKQNYTKMSFAYHMHGADVGRLRVRQTLRFGSCAPKNTTYLWNLAGDQGDAWETAEVQLDIADAKSMTVSFVVRVGGGIKGDIAIDNIKFK